MNVEIELGKWSDYFPIKDEQLEVFLQRGKDIFNIDRDDCAWAYLLEAWCNPDSKIRQTTLWGHRIKQYRNASLTTLYDRIFRDYQKDNEDDASQ